MSLLERMQSNRLLQDRNFMQQRIRKQRLENTFYPTRARSDSLGALSEQIDAILLEADRRFVAGATADEIFKLQSCVAELQDQVASESGMRALGLRVVGSSYWGDNIGHMGLLDTLGKLRALGLLSPERRVILMQHPANEHYLDAWRQHFDVLAMSRAETREFNRLTVALQEIIGVFRTSSGPIGLYEAVNLANRSWADRPPLLKLSEEDRDWGRGQLELLGLDRDQWFVGLHVRAGERRRSRSAPDADVNSYIPAMEKVVAAGGAVVRMGNPLMPPLPAMRGVVDLAHSPVRSARLDLFLFAECQFFIGTASGPLNVPPTYGIPVLFTNCPALGITQWFRDSLMIPKMVVRKGSTEPLSLASTMATRAAWTANPDASPDHYLLDNSPEEIASATEEMLVAGRGKEPMLRGGSDLQRDAEEVCAQYSRTSGAVLAQSFLERHREWL